MPIRLVTFDALYTLLEPRAPIAVQYADLFRPYLGPLDPVAIHAAFKPGTHSPHTHPPTHSHIHPLTLTLKSKRINTQPSSAHRKPPRPHPTDSGLPFCTTLPSPPAPTPPYSSRASLPSSPPHSAASARARDTRFTMMFSLRVRVCFDCVLMDVSVSVCEEEAEWGVV